MESSSTQGMNSVSLSLQRMSARRPSKQKMARKYSNQQRGIDAMLARNEPVDINDLLPPATVIIKRRVEKASTRQLREQAAPGELSAKVEKVVERAETFDEQANRLAQAWGLKE